MYLPATVPTDVEDTKFDFRIGDSTDSKCMLFERNSFLFCCLVEVLRVYWVSRFAEDEIR